MRQKADVMLRSRLPVMAAVLAALGLGGQVQAFEIPTNNSDLKVQWDNTFKYSTVLRLKDPSQRIVDGDPPLGAPPPGPQLDDGDLNFKKGIVSKRLDWLTEFDAKYKNVGLRLTGAAWYDDTYNQRNDNTSASVNSLSVPAGQFTDATKTMMGKKAEVLDAFLYLKSDQESETPFTVRVGKHTLLYGESLFFGANGIANAQAPMDLIKLLSVPGSQFKEIIRPVGQISGQVQLTPSMALGGYYQYRWEANRIPAAGSYLSDADFVGEGSESLFPGIPPLFMKHGKDIDGKNSGQGGLQLRLRPGSGDVEYGLYAARYNDKGPQIMLSPGAFGGSSSYRLVYANDVNTYGGSFSGVVGEANVAGEISLRTNAPLVSHPVVDVPLAGNGDDNPLYAVGRTFHAQVSSIYLMNKSAIWDGASVLAELAFNRTLSIQKNPLALDPGVTRDAWAFRMIFEPQYFQVWSGVDLTVPIGLGYNPSGRSSAVFKFNGGAEHGGDVSIGMKFDFQKKWNAALNLVHFYGKENAFLSPNTTSNATSLYMLNGAQSLRDRDFISFQVQTTF